MARGAWINSGCEAHGYARASKNAEARSVLVVDMPKTPSQHHLWWQAQDRKVLKRIKTLIKDISRNANEGIGKPEPLQYGFQGYWSRRITDEHRIIYKVMEDEIRIAQCRFHYEN
jgi:toxin YoeB